MGHLSGWPLLRGLFDAALQDYENTTNITLARHSFAEELHNFHSVESITTFLQHKARDFGDFQGSERIMKSIEATVSTLSMLSATAALGDSVHWSFSPVKAIQTALAVFLVAAKRAKSSHDELTDLFETIEHLLKSIDIYTQITPTPAMDEMMVKIMIELLSMLALATKALDLGRDAKFLRKIFGENDVKAVLQRLDRLSHSEAQVTAAEILRVVYGLAQNMNGKTSGDRIREALEILHQMTSDLNKSKRDQLRTAVREWLSPPDPWKNHHIAHGSRHEATAEWFVRSEAFGKWKASEMGSLLWIHGKPGAGKSVLCSTIIEEINVMRKSGLASLGFFYIDFRDDQKKDRHGLLSSLLFQLCHQSDSYCDILSRFYAEHANGSRHPSDSALVRCVTEIVKLPGQAPVFLILDALDECSNTSAMPSPRENVLKLVRGLIASQLPHLHICITSRPEADIKVILDPMAFRSVSLHDERGHMEDIKNYVTSVINNVSKNQNRRWRIEDKQLVIEALTKRADGMFRWVYCQLTYILDCHPGQIRRSLSELPATLDETYERTLQKINNSDWQLALRLFQCVAVTSRPLRIEELAEFLAFDLKAGSIINIHEDWRLEDPVEAVLSTCSILLTHVGVDDSAVIQFSHFSVKEFLTSSRLDNSSDQSLRRFHISMAPAHTLVAQACLGNLLHLDGAITGDKLGGYPLSVYAAQHWFEHARFKGVSRYIEDGMKQMFDPNKPHLAIWLYLFDADGTNFSTSSERDEKPLAPRGTPLHHAAFCGLHEIVQFLVIEHSCDLHSRDFDNQSTPLHVASIHGHIEVARILVEHGADVTARDNDGKTPLHVASRNGHVEVSRFLVDHGADVAARNNGGWTPLYWASIEGHMEIADLLIECGADPTAQAYDGRTALHWASTYGHVDIAQFLVEHGVDRAVRDNDGRTPLHLASIHGYVEVAHFLAEHGADVTARDHDGQTPMHFASSYGYSDIVRMLFEYGADALAQADSGQTPLHVAASYGNVEVARMLIEYGADVTARAINGWTPLHDASSCGCVQIVRLLVEHGANETARDNYGLTPWDVASRKGHIEVAHFLVKRGAYTTSQTNDSWTPLHVAVEEGNLEVTRILVENSAYSTARANNGWSPLHVAAEQGNLEVVRILVEHGADMTARADNGWTPLHVASSRGSMGVARFLIEHGVDLTTRDNDGRTPLHEALSYGHVELARFLFEQGTLATSARPTQRRRYFSYFVIFCLFIELYFYFM